MPENQTQPMSAAARDYSNLYLPAAIVIAGALVGVGLFFGLSHTSSGIVSGPPSQTVNVKDVKTGGEPYVGNSNAPLTMAYWSDYQCPYCKAVEVGGVPQIAVDPSIPMILKNYVDKGKLKIVFKDFAFLGQDSITDAEYARAIWALYPDKFYAWREAMYKAQDQEGDQGFGDAASVDALIKTIPGIDLARVKSTLAANKTTYDAAIQADTAEGEGFGIQGTPGFIIGTQSIDGAQSPSAFTAAIDSQLK